MTFRSDNLEPVPSGFCEHRILAAICRLCPADAGTWTAADPLTVTGGEPQVWHTVSASRDIDWGPAAVLLAFLLGLALGLTAGGAR